MTEELDCFPTLEKAEEYCALKKRNAEMIRRLLCWLGCHEWKYIPLREWEKLLKKGHKGHLMFKCKHCGKLKK